MMTSRNRLPLAMLAVVALHGVLSVAIPSQAWVTALSLALASILGLIASLRCARTSEGDMYVRWRLAGASFLLWMTGYAITFYRDGIVHIDQEAAGPQDLIFLLRGVPLLFALSMPNEDRESPVFPWLDRAQMLLAALLAYLVVFPNLLVFGQGSMPMSDEHLGLALDIENLLLVGVVALRLLARPSPRENRFYLCLGAYLVSYTIFSSFVNHYVIDMARMPPGSPAMLCLEIPFVLFVLCTIYLKTNKAAETERKPNRVALCIGYGSPVFFTLAVVLLGATIVKEHTVTGVVAISGGLLLYGLRATILQLRYVETQGLLQGVMDRLEEVSRLDALTGIQNRRSFDTSLDVSWNMARRGGQPLAVLMIDVDYFKIYNDTQGHQKGDECLVTVASVLRGQLHREADFVARYGGEEFAVILPFTDLGGAQFVAQSLRQAIQQLGLPHVGSAFGVLTVSIGVASTIPHVGDNSEDLITAADKALYRAKKNGRNRVELARDP